MAYPKARITRSRSRNMRKKHLVKSKRNNRSRKSKKTHSRKYRGGDSAVPANVIQEMINSGKAMVMSSDTNFAKVSSIYKPSEKIDNFLAKSEPGDTPTFLGSSSGGALEHFLYHSDGGNKFLVYYEPGKKNLTVFHLDGWMIDAIQNQEKMERV